MKKFLIIIVSIVVLLALYFGEAALKMVGISKTTDRFVTSDWSVGAKDSSVKIHLVGLASSKISYNFAKAFENSAKKLIDTKKIQLAVEFIGLPESRDFHSVVKSISNEKLGTILLLAPDVNLTPVSSELVNSEKVLTILFSADHNSVCNGGVKSEFVWNFGIPLISYTETFLSFINQKYSRLAQELPIFTYVNDTPSLKSQSEILISAIKGLGFKSSGKLIVDERIEDLYATVRRVFDYNPKVVIGLVNRHGFHNFIPAAAKLNLGFDIGLAFIEGAFEEDLLDLSKSSQGIILPLPFIAGSNNSNNHQNFTASAYQGVLVAGVLGKLFFRIPDAGFDRGSLLTAVNNLDGVQLNGPSGLVTIDLATKGLIQPLHVGEFRNDRVNHVQYLGDVSLSKEEICKFE